MVAGTVSVSLSAVRGVAAVGVLSCANVGALRAGVLGGRRMASLTGRPGGERTPFRGRLHTRRDLPLSEQCRAAAARGRSSNVRWAYVGGGAHRLKRLRVHFRRTWE